MAALGLLQHKTLACIVQLVVVCLHIRNAVVHVAAAQQHNSSSCFPSDLQALSSFAAGLPDAILSIHEGDDFNTAPMNVSWRISEHDCCSWEGVRCSTDAQKNSSLYARRVTALSLYFGEVSVVSSATVLESLCNLPLLSTLQLSGIITDPLQLIPECLGEQLPLLQVLQLSDLNLKGPIPSSFSRLLHLQHLDLSGNYPALSGALLPLLHLPNLTSLSLQLCNFSGPLPNFHTPLLQTLDLSENAFSGPLPTFNSTPLLQSLHLSENAFSGPLPTFNSTPLLQSLDLSYLISISGPIPSSISRLSNLQSLSLARNSLSGTLPDSLSELSHLITLDLSYNKFTGPFPPWIGHFSRLAALDLSSNQFAGPIPDKWQNLQNLSSINLGSGNSLNGTTLPQWLFRFPKLSMLQLNSLGLQSEDVLCSTRVSMLNKTLELLDLSGNNITGSDLLECFALHNFQQRLEIQLAENPLFIPLSNIQLAPAIYVLGLRACNLTGFLNHKVFEGRFFLDLSHNHLVGKIPTKHTNLTARLTSLDLSNNHLTGFDSYGSFQSLQEIELSNNSIAGDVSTVLQALGLICSTNSVSWISLSLSYNELVGQIPVSLAECNSYLRIHLDHNYLTGQIPASLAEYKNDQLSSLHLDHNYLTGQIPENFGNFKYMYSLRLSKNQLKGTIPASIIANEILLLELGYNQLEGDLKTLFSFLQSPSNLIVLGLAHNRISGSIPPSLGSFTPSLRVIDLSYNNLTGHIPQDLYLPSFQYVEIMSDIHDDMTALYAEIPPLVIKGVERTLDYVLRNFRFLDLSENHLEGVIPSELGDFSALLQLNLSHNSLSGPIPEAFGKLSMLETLDLSFNKLQGSIPPNLSSLTKLAVFNVSYNEVLGGSITPGSQLENNESYIGDPLLCGYEVLHRACQVVDVTNASSNMTINDKVATWMDEWVSVPGLCLGIVVGFFGVLWLLHGPPRLPK